MPHRIRSSIVFLFSQRLVMNTAYRFVYPFLPVIARGLGVPLEQAALLVSVRHISGLATPGAMKLVGHGDRHRRVIVTASMLFAVGSAVTVITSAYVGALIGFALIGLAKPVFDASAQAYVADRVPYERRARSLAVIEFTWAGSLLIGAPAVGWLIARTNWATPFWAFGALSVAAVILAPRFLDADQPLKTGSESRVRFSRSALAFLVVGGFFSLASEMIVVVFGAWLEDSFGLSLIALGGAAILIGASELAGEGATFTFTDRIGKRRSVIAGLTISTFGFLLLAPLHSNMTLGLAALSIALFGFEFTIVSSIPLASELVPGARARYLAWWVVAVSLARSLGAVAGPFLFKSFGIPGPAIAAVAADLIAAAVVIMWVRENATRPDSAHTDR